MLDRTCACGAPNPYPHSRACPACSRASSKRHRDGHKPAAQRRYRETLALRTPLELAVRSARAYLSVHVRRGKAEKRPCAACEAPDAYPVQPWPSQPLLHAWACRKHRARVEAELLAGDREPIGDPRTVSYRPRRERIAAAGKALAPPTGGVTRENVEKYLALLPADVAAAIRERARRVGPIRVEPTAPMYFMQLVKFVTAALDKHS